MTTPTTAERARQFIDDVLAIYAEHGMRSVTSEGAYEVAVANAARQAERLERAIARSARMARSRPR
jgi:hypothetical protein